MLKRTSAGGTCINHVVMHFAQGNLPFGGVNNSGIGSAHGEFGFKAFSHERAVVRTRFNIATLLYRSEEHKSELQSLMRISYAVFCLKKNIIIVNNHDNH